MNRPMWTLMSAAALPFVLLASSLAFADFVLDWWTLDGGGAMWNASGDFELSGTIGQPDAGPVMAGGDFELIGGFWVVTVSGPAVLVGDLNCDGQIGFGDINAFVLRLSNPAAYFAQYPDCPDANGDINGDGEVDFGDINPFVVLLSL